MPPLTEEEILELLSQGNVAANSYGSGPGYLSATKNPYDTLGWREGALSDVFRTAGIYPEDLLGLPDAPEQPETPDIYQSDIAGMYASNPLYAEFQAALDRGDDPVTAVNTIRALVSQQPELKQYVPQGVSSNQFGGEQAYDDWDAFTQTATQIATDQARTNREQGQYDSEMAAYERYYQPQSEFELIGSPELEDFIESQYGGYQIANRPRTQQGLDRERDLDPVASSQFAMDSAYDRRGLGAGTTRSDPVLSPSVVRQIGRTGREEAVPEQYQGLNMGVASTSNALINSFAKKRLAEAQNNILPSQHEQDNRTRLQHAYQLLLGEAAPVRDPDKGAQPVNRQLSGDARKLKSIDYKKRSSKR